MPIPRLRFTLAAVMAAVALIALGLAWRPLFFLMGLSGPAAFAAARYGVPRAIGGLLAAAPVALLPCHILVARVLKVFTAITWASPTAPSASWLVA